MHPLAATKTSSKTGEVRQRETENVHTRYMVAAPILLEINVAPRTRLNLLRRLLFLMMKSPPLILVVPGTRLAFMPWHPVRETHRKPTLVTSNPWMRTPIFINLPGVTFGIQTPPKIRIRFPLPLAKRVKLRLSRKASDVVDSPELLAFQVWAGYLVDVPIVESCFEVLPETLGAC